MKIVQMVRTHCATLIYIVFKHCEIGMKTQGKVVAKDTHRSMNVVHTHNLLMQKINILQASKKILPKHNQTIADELNLRQKGTLRIPNAKKPRIILSFISLRLHVNY